LDAEAVLFIPFDALFLSMIGDENRIAEFDSHSLVDVPPSSVDDDPPTPFRGEFVVDVGILIKLDILCAESRACATFPTNRLA